MDKELLGAELSWNLASKMAPVSIYTQKTVITCHVCDGSHNNWLIKMSINYIWREQKVYYSMYASVISISNKVTMLPILSWSVITIHNWINVNVCLVVSETRRNFFFIQVHRHSPFPNSTHEPFWEGFCGPRLRDPLSKEHTSQF